MATLGCGYEITQDTTLDSDLTCAAGPALVIAADNVTLDLGGHSVSGPAAPGSGPAILLRNVSECTVRNGTVEHFDAGIVISGGGDNVVEHVTAQDNVGAPDGDFGDGIVLSSSIDNRIRHNTVQRNGPFSGISLVQDCSGNDIHDNVVSDNNMMQTGDPSAGRQDMGIRLEGPAASHNKVTRNHVTGSGSNGITIHPTCINLDSCAGTPPNEHNELAYNTANHNGTSGRGDGITLFNAGQAVAPTRNAVMHNTAEHNATYGIAFDGGSSENRAAGNRAQGNATYDGYDGNSSPACDANAWERNHFALVNQPCVSQPVSRAASGLRVDPGASSSVGAQG